MKWAFTFIAGLLFFAIFLTPQFASTQTAEIAQHVSHVVELERKTQTRKSFDLKFVGCRQKCDDAFKCLLALRVHGGCAEKGTDENLFRSARDPMWGPQIHG